MRAKQLWSLIKQAVSDWSDDYAPSMGAALSYYTLFSIGPLLVIVIAVAGLFFGADAVRGALLAQISGLMGDQSAQAIQEMLAHASTPGQGGLATVVGAIVLLLGASSVFAELQNDLDRIWHVPEKIKPSGLWGLLRTRLLSFGMIMGLAFLLMVSLVISAVIAALGKWWGPYFGAWTVLAHALDIAVSLGLITVIFALIYKTMPSIPVHWREVWIGSIVTAVLFTIGKFLIGLYIGKSNVASSFGAFGSLALLMVWVYYSAQIFLFGAEFTRVHSKAARPAEQPKPQSVPGVTRVPALAKTAANEPTRPSAAARDALIARRARVPNPAEIVIRDGRLIVDPSRRGVQVRNRRRVGTVRMAAARSRRPLVAMGVAAAAGVIVGLLSRVRGVRLAHAS